MSKKERPIYENEDWLEEKKILEGIIDLDGLSELIVKRIEELKGEILEKYFLEINTGGEFQIKDGHGGYYDDTIKSHDLVIIHPEMRVVGKVKYENLSSDLSLFYGD